MERASISQTDDVRKLNTYYEEKFDFLISEIIKICEIPAPTFQEDARGDYVLKRMKNFEKLIVHKDPAKNIIIRYPGIDNKAKLAVLAHLDTVFPFSSITVKQTSDSLEAPGIGDNSTSVGVMLQIIESWNAINFIPPFDIIFVANSCEEGLGDLKGVKSFLDDYCSKSSNNINLKALLSIDGTLERITHIGTGVKRYELTIHTKGGHSWANFGEEESAIHIIANIVADISRIKVPNNPKTTYNVGTIKGGTSVNTIAEDSSILIDLRSTNENELNRLNTQLENIIKYHTKDKKNVQVKLNLVGNRPSGRIEASHPLVSLVKDSAQEVKLDFIPLSGVASTDANVPLSRNIPALAFGCYSGLGAHTKAEKIYIKSLTKGVPFSNLVILKTINWIETLLL